MIEQLSRDFFHFVKCGMVGFISGLYARFFLLAILIF